MEKKKHSSGWGTGFAVGIVATVLAAIAAAMIVVYTGAYNVAANDDHTSMVRWAFETTMYNSVQARADDIEVPQDIGDASAGAADYKAMCQHCHAGPGVKRAAWANGMLPLPPHLTKHASEWEPDEIFWLVKNGVKMSAMPAFGAHGDDQKLWNIVAFVKQLPGMTAEEYAAVEGSSHAAKH
ncbi:c-type cytochrome [Allohahella sp. A8]|uniref:c-type cytochrome n=1 Tax=Allohahella sp. A8 TaxID=3141461 RepID=UPI000C09B1BA|nr:class I triheme cytochrome c [Hahellaceae bacterium]|tara:strand:- start:15799 stop:16344 length:546 start_codon:yes stop_codon:yes gene_type:complete